MANTIKATASLECIPLTGTYGRLPRFGGEQTISQATAGVSCPQFALTTTHSALTFPGLTQARWIRFENIDVTNKIQLGVEVSAAFYPLVELFPGESFPFPLKAAVSMFAKAATGTAKLNTQALET